ncbi:MAG: hypothetical protein ACI8RZ_007432 [Myxococcota bacterium]|jgi:hypothetical protein
MPAQPLTLLLPFRLVDESFSLVMLLASDPERSGADTWRLQEVFAMSSREEAFVRRLLRKKRNIWIFRCNQRGWCGDFVIVDMSQPDARRRLAVVIELKSGAALKRGGGGLQVKNASAAIAELTASGVLGEEPEVVTWLGSKEAVLAELGASEV